MERVDGLEVDGGAGDDEFNVFDENNPYELPGGGRYTITPDRIQRYEEHVIFDDVAVPIDVDYDNVESVALASGYLGDKFYVEGTAGVGTLSLDGNGGGDEFHVPSPAFEQINIAGDNPIFAPGDQLYVNEDGLYATAWVPGLYVLGSGEVTIDTSTVSYSGIETMDLQEQLHGGPGDFDEDGDVDHVDLTHATKGWHERYGDDLHGSDFLDWQRRYGNSLPRRAPATLASSLIASETASEPLALGLASAEPNLEDEDELDAMVWDWPVAEADPVGPHQATTPEAASAVAEAPLADGNAVADAAAATSDELAARDAVFAEWVLGATV